jgi:hypothetical protein
VDASAATPKAAAPGGEAPKEAPRDRTLSKEMVDLLMGSSDDDAADKTAGEKSPVMGEGDFLELEKELSLKSTDL